MRVIKISSVLVAAFLGMFVGSARAEETIVVKVPFPFVVGTTELPAGHYDISNDQGLLLIRGRDNTAGGIFAPALPADGLDPDGAQPALVFTRYENEYVLSQVWESSNEGFKLREASGVSRRAETQPVASTVVVAADAK
jgi:hypothetical protein